MNPGNLLGALSLVNKRPALAHVAANNIRGRLRRKLAWDQEDDHCAPPEQITVLVTDICNLRCKMCQYAFSDSQDYQLSRVGHIDVKLFQKIIDEMPGKAAVSITGGEPLLHAEISGLITYAKECGHPVTLTSNGWMLNKRAIDICAAGLDLLIISVDGPERTHNEIRGAKSFQRLAEGIKMVLALPNRPVLFLSMAISNYNADQIEVMYELARKWGVDGINFNHLWIQCEEMVSAMQDHYPDMGCDTVSWQVQPDLVDLAALAAGFEAVRRRNRYERFIVTELPLLSREQLAVWYQEPARFVKYTSTRCAWTRMKIWSDGQVKPCRDWSVGNVAEENLTDIWNNRQFMGFRDMLARESVIPICSRCCYMTHR